MKKFLCFMAILVSATVYMYFIIYFCPFAEGSENIKFPKSLADLNILYSYLKHYQLKYPKYTLLLYCSAYLYKQSFAIPGSFFLNLLCGALYGFSFGSLLVCLLCSFGSSFCFMLSKMFGKTYIVTRLPIKVQNFKNSVNANQHRLFFYCLSVRLFPMTPNWFVNLVSPIVEIPIYIFFPSVFFGLLPYNCITVRAGEILSTIKNVKDIFTFNSMILLFCMTGLALVPPYFIKDRNISQQNLIDMTEDKKLLFQEISKTN